MKAQDVLNLLLPIPAEDFITERFTDEISKCCAIGHIERLTSENPSDYRHPNCTDRKYGRQGSAFRAITEKFILQQHGLPSVTLSEVNNRPGVNGYTEPVIKDRVIHLLKDMIAAGY